MGIGIQGDRVRRREEQADRGERRTVRYGTISGGKYGWRCPRSGIEEPLRKALDLDARKRNYLQAKGWTVLTYWDAAILRDPDECARQIAGVLTSRCTGPGKPLAGLRAKIAGKEEVLIFSCAEGRG